jgi:hypothetical protein
MAPRELSSIGEARLASAAEVSVGPARTGSRPEHSKHTTALLSTPAGPPMGLGDTDLSRAPSYLASAAMPTGACKIRRYFNLIRAGCFSPTKPYQNPTQGGPPASIRTQKALEAPHVILEA